MIEIHFKISCVKFLMHMLKKETLLAYAVVIVQPLRHLSYNAHKSSPKINTK